MKRIVLTPEQMDQALGLVTIEAPARVAMSTHWDGCRECDPTASTYCAEGVRLHRAYLAETFPAPPPVDVRGVRWTATTIDLKDVATKVDFVRRIPDEDED